jgi:hypothetical protein
LSARGWPFTAEKPYAGSVGEVEREVKRAIQHFWSVREQQAGKQGHDDAQARDRGQRGAVTGGKQMDGFIQLVSDLLVAAGLKSATIYFRSNTEASPSSSVRTKLPGWYRAEKDWDLIVAVDGCLVAAIEFKSQVGSFGNNFNNRTEEALGNATDLWAAYREGALQPSQRPWLGYLMLLEDAPGSTRPVKVYEPHFKVFSEFHDASYARRYEILLTKLVRERLYDAGCLLMSRWSDGLKGQYTEPNVELSFEKFVSSLLAKAIAVAQTQPPGPAEAPVVREG